MKNCTLWLLLVFALALWADEIHLKNGKILNGKATKRANGYELNSQGIISFIKNSEIRKVVLKKTAYEIFAELYRKTDRRSVRALLALAQWCRKNLPQKRKLILEEAYTLLLDKTADGGRKEWDNLANWCRKYLPEKESEVRRQIAELDFAKKIAAAGDDPRQLYEVAQWARRNQIAEQLHHQLLKKIINLEPQHSGARFDLGQVQYQGRWLDAVEARRIEQRDHAAAMREKGMVSFNGEWMSAEEAEWQALVSSLQGKIAELQRQQDELQNEHNKALDRLKIASQEVAELVQRQRQAQAIIDQQSHELDEFRRAAVILRQDAERFRQQLNIAVFALRDVLRRINSRIPVATGESELRFLRSLRSFILRTLRSFEGH